MKTWVWKIMALLSLTGLMLTGSGCGKADNTDSTTGKDYVYELTPLTLTEGDFTYSNIMKAGDRVYVYGLQYEEDACILKLAALDEEEAVGEEFSYAMEENTGLSYLGCDEEGMIYGITDVYAMDADENGYYIDNYYLVKLNDKGEELFRLYLNELPEVQQIVEENGGWFYVGNTMLLNDSIYVEITDEYLVFDKEGNFQRFFNEEGNETLSSMYFYPLADGKVAGFVYEEDGGYLYDVNMDEGSYSEPVKFPGISYECTFYRGDSRYQFYVVNSYGVFGYNIGDEQMTPLMNYVDSDLAVYNVYHVLSINDEEFYAVYDDEETYESCLGRFTKVPPEEVKDRKSIVLACVGIDWYVKKDVIKFNKSNEDYKITIQDYSALYGTDSGNDTAIEKLNADIISGNIPDILLLNTNMPVDSYIAKGLFADLKPIIEADEELDIEDFLPNIIEAYSVEGKLYRLVPSFAIDTLLAKTSDVGEERGWTVQDVNELMSTKPEGTTLLGNITRSYMLYSCMSMAGDQFIDWDTGKCSFDSEDFVETLEFLKQFPEEIDSSIYDDDSYWDNYDTMWREGRTVGMIYFLSSFRDYNYVAKGTFGEPVTAIGFPSGNGDGSAIRADNEFALLSKSPNQEGAWQFLRYYLTEEYQSDVSGGFPISIKSFDAMGEKALKNPTYTDEDGNEVESQDYAWINGVDIPIEPMTEEELAKFKEVMYSFTQVYHYDTDLVQIIEEEAEAFFNGQKSAEDVAAIIQSRAQIYVQENR